MTNPYRAMCAELLEWAERTSSHYYKQADVIVRARALLAQPEPEGPTDEDLEDLAEVMNVSGNPVPAMRRALELWGCRSINLSQRPHDCQGSEKIDRAKSSNTKTLFGYC